jgi:predicted permease
VFLAVISIIAPIFLIVLTAYVYARYEKPDMQVINKMIMQLFVPALIFYAMSRDDFHISDYTGLALGATGVIIGSGILAYFVAKLLKYQVRTFVPSMMFLNWGNLGIPLIVFTFGENALNAAIVLFITGNLLQFTLGIIIHSGKFELGKFVKNPMMIAIVLGLVVNLAEINLPLLILRPIDMLGHAAIPLMLVSLGVRLQSVRWNDLNIALIGAFFTPIVGLFMAYAFGTMLGLENNQFQQLLIFGALPPAVMNYMFAEQYNNEPDKVASIVLVSNLFSVITYFLLLYTIIPPAGNI